MYVTYIKVVPCATLYLTVGQSICDNQNLDSFVVGKEGDFGIRGTDTPPFSIFNIFVTCILATFD